MLANISAIRNGIISNEELAGELHKTIIRKEKRKKRRKQMRKEKYTHLLYTDNIWGADLADMQLTSKFDVGFIFLLCVIDIYSKYAWVIPLKDRKGITITNAFQKILDKSNCKPNKMWVNKGREFYNTSMKSFLQNNDVEMYSAHNEGKSIIAERFIRTLKNKFMNT